jgi:molybdopterin-guanine dinucleotide biosynthesis protein
MSLLLRQKQYLQKMQQLKSILHNLHIAIVDTVLKENFKNLPLNIILLSTQI